MPELRQDQFTKEWVIIATERAKRPEELVNKLERKVLPHYSPTCAFCPGNEKMAPPAVFETMGHDGKWQIRVIPNKFPALTREGWPEWKIERAHRTINGVGMHDVIVETPDHAITTALLSTAQVATILDAYQRRFAEVSSDERVVHVTLFKNHGNSAGASPEHPHSQMIATPGDLTPVRNRLYEALRHYDEFGECTFCNVIEQESKDTVRVVMASEHFLAVEPFASATPFTTHLYPRRHMASFGDINEDEKKGLANVLRTVLAKLYVGLADPDYNYIIRTSPAESAGVKYYHWYLAIIPRLTKVAGFELGSGMFINTVLPEAAAEFLRNTSIAALPGAEAASSATGSSATESTTGS